MTAATPLPHADRLTPSDRRAMILDAFERCIVRTGFHRSTMQDVASEVGMSVGNLYRYFDSKEALVSGMIERDRERLRADFAFAGAQTDMLAAMRTLGRKHFVDEPRERSMQVIEIWTEAMHNPKVADMVLGIEAECAAKIVALLERARAQGQIQPRLETYKIVEIIMALGDGILRRRALDPAFDAEDGFRDIFAVLDLLLHPNPSHSDLPRTAAAALPLSA